MRMLLAEVLWFLSNRLDDLAVWLVVPSADRSMPVLTRPLMHAADQECLDLWDTPEGGI